MAIYLITISLDAPQAIPPMLRSVLIGMEAREIMRGTCLVETETVVHEVMAQIGATLGPRDALFMTEITRGAHWAGGRVDRPAMLWLKEKRP